MLLVRSSVRRGSSRLWSDANPVVELADKLDAEVPPNAPIAARYRLLHPFRSGVSNVALRTVPLLALSAFLLGRDDSQTIPIALGTGFAAFLLALTGLQVDAPRFTTMLYRFFDQGSWVFVGLALAMSVGCVVLLLVWQMDTALRIGLLLATFLLGFVTRNVLATTWSGGMLRRHRRRILGVLLTQLLWLCSGWTVVLVVNYLLPSADAGDRRDTVRWVLGSLLLVAGYTAAVSRRRQRLYARLIDGIDDLIKMIGRAERGEDVNKDEASRAVLTLDRLLGASLDSGFLSLSVRFESAGLRSAFRTLAAAALQLNIDRQPSVLPKSGLASTVVAKWSTDDCLRHLRTYLIALRQQLEPSEDVLSV